MPEWASFDSSYSNTPQEYPGWGNGLDVEPALKVSFANGNRELLLHYQSHTATAQGFDIVLKDISLNILVTLHYSMDPDTGILARSATIENREAASVTVEQAAAAAWALPAAHYTLNYLTGRWAGEWTLTQEPMYPGERVMESRRGSTGHQANPWFALEGEGASEDHGDVWFGALAWSCLLYTSTSSRPISTYGLRKRPSRYLHAAYYAGAARGSGCTCLLYTSRCV